MKRLQLRVLKIRGSKYSCKKSAENWTEILGKDMFQVRIFDAGHGSRRGKGYVNF